MNAQRIAALLIAVFLGAATAPLSTQQAPADRRAEFERLGQGRARPTPGHDHRPRRA